MKKLRKEDVAQEVFDLYDAYAHNQLGRREFIDKLSTYAVGGVTLMTATTFDTLTRGEFGTTAAAISDNAVVGEVYNSGILTLEGYTEVATKLLSSNTGQTRFIWYSDSTGTDTIRTLPPSYPPAHHSTSPIHLVHPQPPCAL